MTLPQLDYSRLDKDIAFNFRADYQKVLDKLGLEFISEAVAIFYYEKKLPCSEIADIFGVNKMTVNRWMSKWGMQRRNRNGSGNAWNYGRFCIDCGCDTVVGYRVKGRCIPCYQRWVTNGRIN